MALVQQREPFGGLTGNQRRTIARIGGLSLHAKHDTHEVSAPGRKAAKDALAARLLAEIDPDGTLLEPDRARRLALARKAHFTLLAYRSARARAKRTTVNKP